MTPRIPQCLLSNGDVDHLLNLSGHVQASKQK